MKKFLIATGIATLAFVSVASAQTFEPFMNLTVGSTGVEVSNLQTWLLDNNFNIPAISTGVAVKGYFGSQTQAAVAAYQRTVGLPSQGYFGPLTRAKITMGGGGGTVSPISSGCMSGWTAATYQGSSFCLPPGFSVPGSTITPEPTNVSDNKDGSISVTTSSFVSTGANLKKGETKNVVAIKLQATAGSVSVTRVDANFSVRPWLFFSQAVLKDSSGKVIATKNLSSINDVTEITVGSNYLVRFEGLNYIVAPGTNPDLAVGVSVLAATDKITNGMNVNVNIPTGAIRTVNGLGIFESVGGVAIGSTGAGAATFTLSSTGSVADISTKISSNAPATQATVAVSATVPKNDITLGIFSLKSANNDSTINGLNLQTNTSVSTASQTGIFSNVRIIIGSNTYGALSYSAAGLATFTNLNIPLTQDVWTDVKLIADVAATSTDVIASSTLLAANINAIDSTYTAATVGGVAMASASNNQISLNTLMTVNSVSLSLGASPAVVTQEIKGKVNSSVTTAGAVKYTFTLTNNSSNSLYVSSNIATLINGTSTVATGNASSTLSAVDPIIAVAGDGSGYYLLPTGTPRTFSVSGIIQSRGGATVEERLSITSIQYGATTAGTGNSITSGLTTLTTSIILAPAN